MNNMTDNTEVVANDDNDDCIYALFTCTKLINLLIRKARGICFII